jgi:hypothetical protein
VRGLVRAAFAGFAGLLVACGGGVETEDGAGGAGGSSTSTSPTTTSGAPTSSGGGSGVTCGGLVAAVCASADERCDFPTDNCGHVDQSGVCVPRPEGCDDVYSPRCACDGTVYENDCAAYAAGVDISNDGGCAAPEGMTPCGPRFCAANVEYCHRETSDVGGIPSGYSCLAVPPACDGTGPTCACLAAEPCASDSCVEENGAVTIRSEKPLLAIEATS